MPRKNLISLHEAIVIALISKPDRKMTFEEIANFITDRDLYPKREGNIELSKQIMLRSTKSKGAYHHLFQQVSENSIILRNI